MLSLLKEYKYGIIAILFAVYSLGLWHVCSKYTESSYTKEKLELQTKALETTQQRLDLAKMIGEQLDKKLSDRFAKQQVLKQEVIHEIKTQPVYTDCRTTPNGVRLIEQAIDQGYPGKSSGNVQVPTDR